MDKRKRFEEYYNNENTKVENNTETKIRRKEISERIMMKRKKLNLIYSEQVTKTVKNNGYKIKF